MTELLGSSDSLDSRSLLPLPQQPARVEDRTILAHSKITLRGFLHAAQTGAQSTRHQVLQRSLAINTALTRITRHSHHHRFWPAGLDQVETLTPEYGVISHETLLTHCIILGSEIDSSYLLKMIQLQQIACGPCAQKERRLMTAFTQLNALPEQRSHTYAASYQEHFAAVRKRWGLAEAMAKRQ